jgi:hypothetical protein
MRGTVLITGLMLSVVLLPTFALSAEGSRCGVYREQADKLSNEKKDFYQFVIKPLEQEKIQLKKEINYRKGTPAKLSKKNQKLKKDVRRLEVKKDQLAYDVEHLDDGKKKRNKEKERIRVQYKIENFTVRVEENEARIAEINRTEPAVEELQRRLDEVRLKLGDEAELKKEKDEELSLAKRTLQMCKDYHELVERCNLP